jgi:hypothetical protein
VVDFNVILTALQKVVPGRRTAVELLPSHENDYGMGPGMYYCSADARLAYNSSLAYWKTSTSQPQPQTQSQLQNHTLISPRSSIQSRLPLKAQPQSQVLKGKGRTLVVDSDEEVIEQVVNRAGSPQLAQTRSNPTRSRKGKTQPLFLDSDGDDEEQVQRSNNNGLAPPAALENDETSTLQSSTSRETQIAPRKSARKPASKAKKAPAVTIVDDDSDDGAAFKGFHGRRTRSGR